MRPGSPACYRCPASKRAGMHCWTRNAEGAQCTWCKLQLTGDDAADVFRGAATPIGQLRRPPGLA